MNRLGRLMPLLFWKWHDFLNVLKWSGLQFYNCSGSSTSRTRMTFVILPTGVIKCSRQKKSSCYWICDPMSCSIWIYFVGILFEYWPSLTLLVLGDSKIITQSSMATGHQYQHPEDLNAFLVFAWMYFFYKLHPLLFTKIHDFNCSLERPTIERLSNLPVKLSTVEEFLK